LAAEIEKNIIKPTSLAGIGAVCRYMKSLLEQGTPGLPLENEFGDVESGMGIFCDTIAAAIEGMPLKPSTLT
jgi:hypothetical protein